MLSYILLHICQHILWISDNFCLIELPTEHMSNFTLFYTLSMLCRPYDRARHNTQSNCIHERHGSLCRGEEHSGNVCVFNRSTSHISLFFRERMHCTVLVFVNISRDIQMFIYNINILFCLFMLQLVVGPSEFVRE